jgi:hypothetical protein
MDFTTVLLFHRALHPAPNLENQVSVFMPLSQQNSFKQEAKYYVLRSINSLILFGIRKNCLSNRSLLFTNLQKG